MDFYSVLGITSINTKILGEKMFLGSSFRLQPLLPLEIGPS